MCFPPAQRQCQPEDRRQAESLKCEAKPVYLGVTLDRSLTYHDHLMKTATKVRTRNNIISRLAGSTWGAQTSTLRTAALALCFSVAEYCAPVWCRSAHVNLVDVQLNTTLRTITGTLRSTPIPWLPVLSNIVPASFRRQEAVSRVIGQIQANTNIPSFEAIFNPPRVRLLSKPCVAGVTWPRVLFLVLLERRLVGSNYLERFPCRGLIGSPSWVWFGALRLGLTQPLPHWSWQGVRRASTSGASRTIHSAPVAASRRCPTLSTSVRWRNSTVASGLSTALTAKQLSGFAREAHAKKKKMVTFVHPQINLLESVKRSFTRRSPECSHLFYIDRLTFLKLHADSWTTSSYSRFDYVL